MKVIAIVGSPRKNGNTEIITKHALRAIDEEGVETDLIRLAGLDVQPCNACMACKEDNACSIKDDVPAIYDRMKHADGIILASPVYFGSATAMLKALMERTGYLARNQGDALQRKIGGPIVVARRAGHNFIYAQLMYWFTILGMVVPGSSYWTIAFGREKGEVQKDDEGMRSAWNFGKNIAWLVKGLHTT